MRQLMLPLAILGAMLGACSWSNSLYQARMISGEALRAERDKRPGDALSLWGQVAAKGDSAYARRPGGKRGMEAEWLRGRARERLNDCITAEAELEVAYTTLPDVPWHDQMLLELGRCEDVAGDPRAIPILASLVDSRDTAVRREARLRYGHALVQRGDWAAAVTTLRNVPGKAAVVDRADALIGTGHPAEALAELRPLLAAHDTTVPWGHLVGSFVNVDPLRTDSLLAALMAWPKMREDLRAAWLYPAFAGAIGRDSVAAARYLAQLLPHAPGRVGHDALGLVAKRALTNATTLTALRVAIDSAAAIDDADYANSLIVVQAMALRHLAMRVVSIDSGTASGAPTGDLALFLAAELARDSLNSSAIANTLLTRIEHGWPQSAYLPKVLLTRLSIEPDSAPALRARLATFTASPYLERINGIADPALLHLEDSLATYVRTAMAVRRDATGAQSVQR